MKNILRSQRCILFTNVFILILLFAIMATVEAACTTKDLCVSQLKNDLYICGNDYCMSIADAPRQYADSTPRTATEAAKLFGWGIQTPEQVANIKSIKATINYKILRVAKMKRWKNKTDRPVFYIVQIGNTDIVGIEVKGVRAEIGDVCNKRVVYKQKSQFKYRGIHIRGRQYATICE